MRAPLVALSVAGALLAACGSDPASPPVPTAPPVASPAAPVAPVPAAPAVPQQGAAAAAQPTAPPVPTGPPVDLLHATAAAVATSSAYRDDAAQVAALVDGSLETAWNSRTGDLTGAWIEVRLPADATVSSIAMTAGFTHVTARADLFPGNHRVTRVRVLHDGVEAGTFPLDPDLRTLQTIPVGGAGGVYRIEIAEVLPGARTDWRETCVSELAVMGHAPGEVPGSRRPATAIGTLPELPAVVPAAATAAATGAAGGEHDGVYFAVQEVGLVRIGRDGQLGMVRRGAWNGAHPTPSGGWIALEGTHGPLARSDGAPLDCPRDIGWLFDAAASADGSLWVVGGSGFARWDGAAWHVTRRSTAEGGFDAIAIDRDGTAWMLSRRHGLARARAGAAGAGADGATAEAVAVPGAGELRGLSNDAAGRVVVHHAGGLLARDGETWSSIAAGELYQYAFRADGALASVGREGFRVARSAGASPTTLALGALGVPAGAHVWDVGWDGAGRLWLGTDVGVVAIAPSLDRLERWYPRGTVRELESTAGTHGIFGIGVIAALPAARAARGHVHGRVTRGGAPLAGAQVELCERPDLRFEAIVDGSPCHDAEDGAVTAGTATMADGTFDLVGVPDADLEVTIELGHGRWHVADVDCCAHPERVLDLGTIAIP